MPSADRATHRFDAHTVEPVVSLPSARRSPGPSGPGTPGPTGMPVRGTLDDADSPMDVLDLLVLDAFVVGSEPFARTTHLENVLPQARLLPEQARVIREVVSDDSHGRLVTGEGWTLQATRWKRGRRATVTVTATSLELADAVLRQAIEGAVAPSPPTPERVPIGFWHQTTRGARRIPRDIDANPWQQLRGNYTAGTATAVDVLIGMTGAPTSGRLLLLHGPPGTGKTTLLRTIARHWRPWCQVDCVLDPERLFADPTYLLHVALGDEEETDDERWRLLVLEDCDELIRGDAKASTGQSLSRLLNLTDGLLGQGRNVLVAITTNESLAALHPAVVRPGRCLAQLRVGLLTPSEASTWLAAADSEHQAVIHPDGATLAELYALVSGTPPVTSTEPANNGAGYYL